MLTEQLSSSTSSAKYSFNTTYGKAYVLKDSKGFIFLGISTYTLIAVTQTYYHEENGFSLVEELRQEFFQTYPELLKVPHSNPLFSSDKRYLNDICIKYNSKSGDENLAKAREKIQSTTDRKSVV